MEDPVAILEVIVGLLLDLKFLASREEITWLLTTSMDPRLFMTADGH